ncbi:MAG: hypothetical protein ACXVC3_20005 [Bdellovibrio sp.]
MPKKISSRSRLLAIRTAFELIRSIQIAHFQKEPSDAETIFKIGGCLRDDEMGVTYRVHGTAKGSLGAEVILSEKYPSSDAYKVGTQERLPLNENPRKLYPIKCP